MKRILTLSFIALCLLLSAVLLASCGPTKVPSEHEHVWDEGKVVKEGLVCEIDCEMWIALQPNKDELAYAPF